MCQIILICQILGFDMSLNVAAKTLCQLALKEGFNDSYFFALRKCSPKKFDKIFSFDPDIEKSLAKYKAFVNNTLRQIIEIYYYLEERNEVSKFLKKSKAYSNPNAFERSIFFFIENEVSIFWIKIQKWEETLLKFREIYGENVA